LSANLTTRPRPCEQCPWRTDNARGQFPAARYDELAATTGTPEEPVPPGSPIFTCHKSSGGKELPCAGWLASVGHTNLTIRMALAKGDLTPNDLRAGEDWPPLFETYAEMAAAQGGEGNKWSACFERGCRDFGTPQTVVAGYPCPSCGRGKMIDVDDAMRRRGDY
jgi:hypothetical protein